jgi:Secretion system C-terminal sorting domain
MNKTITILMVLVFCSSAFAQAYFELTSPYDASVIFNVDGIEDNDRLEYIQNVPDYGLKVIGDTWLLNGGQATVVENGATISSVKFYYRIYKEGSPTSWNLVSLDYKGNNTYGRFYKKDFLGINILDHSLVDGAGKYYLEFYFEAETSNPGTISYFLASVPAQGYFTTTSALPVELTTFTAFAEENSVALNWETATEVNNYGFEIERQKLEVSNKKLEWEKIGFVEGHGNSNSPKVYSYIDNTIASGDYFYRLRQVDIDGTFDYSDVVEVNISAPNKFELAQNYPNPFNPKTSIQFSLTNATNVSLVVYNTIGQKVADLINQRMEAGIHNTDFDASNLNSGIYIYMLTTENNTLTKKMILMK